GLRRARPGAGQGLPVRRGGPGADLVPAPGLRPARAPARRRRRRGGATASAAAARRRPRGALNPLTPQPPLPPRGDGEPAISPPPPGGERGWGGEGAAQCPPPASTSSGLSITFTAGGKVR